MGKVTQEKVWESKHYFLDFQKANNLDFKFNDTITFSLKSLRKRQLDFKLLGFFEDFHLLSKRHLQFLMQLLHY